MRSEKETFTVISNNLNPLNTDCWGQLCSVLYAVRYVRHKASVASPNDTTNIPASVVVIKLEIVANLQ